MPWINFFGAIRGLCVPTTVGDILDTPKSYKTKLGGGFSSETAALDMAIVNAGYVALSPLATYTY